MALRGLGRENMSNPADVRIQPNCEDDFEPTLLSVEVALERIAALVEPLLDIEKIPVREALGRDGSFIVYIWQ